MIEKIQRPLIDRPRYIPKPPTNSKKPTVVKTERSRKLNKTITPSVLNEKNKNKHKSNKLNKKVIDKQLQQPVSGSVNKIGEVVSPKTKNSK